MVALGRPPRSSPRSGSGSHSKAQPAGARALATQAPGAASVHATGGGAHGARITHPPPKFDQSVFTAKVSVPVVSVPRHVTPSHTSAFSSPVRSSNHPPAATGGASGSVTISESSCEPITSSAAPASPPPAMKHVPPSCVHGKGKTA